MVDRVRNRLAQNKKPPLEHGLVLDMRAALDKNLAAYRFSRPDARAKTRRIDWRVAPTESDLSFRGDHFFNNVFDDPAALHIARQEQRADGIFARRRQDETEVGCLFGKKAMRDLNQHAAAIARLGIGTDGAAMIQIAQNLEAHGDHFVRLVIAHVRGETDTAGGMLLDGRIKALRGRQAWIRQDAKEDRIRHLSPFLIEYRQNRTAGREVSTPSKRA